MTGTKLLPTVPNLPSNDEITRFDGTDFCKSEKFFLMNTGIIQSEKDKTFNKGPVTIFLDNIPGYLGRTPYRVFQESAFSYY